MDQPNLQTVVDQSINSNLLLTILVDKGSGSSFYECQSMVLQVLASFFASESVDQITWLNKLGIVEILSHCKPHLKQSDGFAHLVYNMLLLQRSDLQTIGIELFTQLCKSALVSHMATNFLADRVSIKARYIGLEFFTKVVA